MDSRLLEHYQRELAHLREAGAEFAREFPRIAARLGLQDGEAALDPDVERLLEGAAFLAARVQLKIDAEFPRFTQQLLGLLYPNCLAPTPSMLVARLQPAPGDINLARGWRLPRGSALRHQARPDRTACEFRTASELELWPLELVEARYFRSAPDLPLAPGCQGGVRLKLRTDAGLAVSALALDRLRIFLGGSSEVAHKLHELIGSACLGGWCGGDGSGSWQRLAAGQVRLLGFDDEEALLPASARGFAGHRLLQEYFAFPARFLFFEIGGLAPGFAACSGSEIELVLCFGRSEPALEGRVGASDFLLHCVAAVNLFERRIDGIALDRGAQEFHVVPDRTRPGDFEVHDLSEVVGHGAGEPAERRFVPLHSSWRGMAAAPPAYFTLRREPRWRPAAQPGRHRLSGYAGGEVFLSLVDPAAPPYPEHLRRLSLRARCTNRDLPLLMRLGEGETDFRLEIAAPVAAIRCAKGPSAPAAPLAPDEQAWRFIGQLALNHLSLLDLDGEQGAAALRELLGLHAGAADAGLRRQVDGLRAVRCEPVVARLPLPGPLCYGRGVGITLELDELAFEGGSAFLFGCVLERWFARHVTLNGFTETVLRTLGRGELMRWGPRCGSRTIL